MPRVEKKKIEHLNVRLPLAEMALLRRYCEVTQRSQSDVIREFIRSLKGEVDAASLTDQVEWRSPTESV